MLQGLAKAKALKEFKALRQDKASLKGLALAKGLKRLRELRADLGMGIQAVDELIYQSPAKADLSILQVSDNPVEVVNHVYKQSQQQYAGKKPKAITVKSDGSVILVGWQGVKHALSNKGNQVKALATTVIETLVENAVFVAILTDKHHGKKPDIKQTLLYKSNLDIGSEVKEIGIVVRELKDGKKLYDYFTEIKNPASTSGGNETVQPLAGDEDSLSNTLNNVKPFNRSQITIPKSKNARQSANNQAIAILDKLDNGEMSVADLSDDDKAALAKYSGNGGGLIGRDGKKGSDYEYYTPQVLAGGMWDLAKELGFDGGRVLDPCAGTGVFTATSPDNVIMDNIELDETSGRINQILNDGVRSNTTISPFEKMVNGYDDGDDDNGFDLVISNVPFGDNSSRGANKMYDKAYQDVSLDYYFIIRSLEKLKSGGLAVLMTAPSTIHGKGARQIELRQRTSRIAEFIGAYRLPNSMFADTGADVSVDVVVFKKFNQRTKQAIKECYEKGDIDTLQQANVLWDDYISGHYFKRHKKNVLGTVQKVKNRFGGESEKVFSELSQSQIAKLMRKLGGSRINWELLNAKEQDAISYKDGDVVFRDGVQYQLQNGVWVEQAQEISADDVKYQDILDKAVNDSLNVSLDDVKAMLKYFTQKGVNSQELNALKQNMGRFKSDVEWQIFHTAKAIENILQHGEMGTNYRAVYPKLSDTMRDVAVLAKAGRYTGEIGTALKLIKLHYAKGAYSDIWNGAVDTTVHQDLDIVGSLSSKIARLQYNKKSKYISIDDFKAIAPDVDVMSDDEYFISHDGTQVIQANDFLVGNVQERLDELDKWIVDCQDDELKTKLIKQKVYAAAQTPKIDVRKASFDLLSPQIPMSYKVEFLNTVSPLSVVQADDRTCEMKGAAKTNLAKVANRIGFYVSGKYRLTLGGVELDGMNEKQGLKYLNDTFAEWNAQFKTWVKANDELLDLLDGKINDLNNRYFVQNDDESELEIHGLSDEIKLHGYQRAFIRNQGRFFGGINGFGVGLGKSFTSLASVQYAHNIGLKKKTLFVVPKSVLSNWRKEAMRLYASLGDCLFIGLRENGDKFTVKSSLYDEDLTKAVSGKYRKIFMTQEAFGKIKLKDSTIDDYFRYLMFNEHIYAQSEGKGKSESIEGKIAKAKDEFFGYAGNAPYLEDMNIDSLVFDEAHHYKNSVATNLDRVKFMGNPTESKRGADAQAKAWYVRGLTPNKDGVQLLTATPVTNSPVEIYSMLSLATGREKVNKMMGGIGGVEDFVNSSCEIGNEEQPRIDGGFGNVDCLQGLKNLAMLRSVFNNSATLKNADDVKGVSVVIPDRNVVDNGVEVSDDVIGELKAMQAAYKQAKAYLDSGNVRDLGDEYWAIKRRYNEPDEIIAHPFSLLTKMSDIILDDDLKELCSFYDFDDGQTKLVKKAIETWNAKPPSELKGRLGVYTKPDDYGEEYNKSGELKGYKTAVKADIITHKGRERIMLDTLDYQLQQKFEAVCEKLGVKLGVSIPAKLSALVDNIKAEMANKRGKKDDGTTSSIVKQIIFCDNLGLHSKIIRVLGEYCGISKNKIAVITGKVNSSAEEILDVQDGFNAMDDDNVYQIIVANEKAEVGINLQKGCQAIHHLTTGWTPDSLEQRNGRGARQGNHTQSVHIYYYDAKGTYDTLKRDMINKKSEWIDSLLNGLGNEVEIRGEISREEQEALIETMGDEAKIQAYLAKKDADELAVRRAKAEFEQNVNVNTIVKQKAILDKTKEQMVHDFILENLIPVANALPKTKIITKSKYGSHEYYDVKNRADFDEKQQKAFDEFVNVFEQVCKLYDFDGMLTSNDYDKLAMTFISRTRSTLGTTKAMGMGSKVNDLYWAFASEMTHNLSDEDKEAYGNKLHDKKMVRTDNKLYQDFAKKQSMARKLIEKSSQTIDDIADKYDGVNRGLGKDIADGMATFLDGVVYRVGDLLKNELGYRVITDVKDGELYAEKDGHFYTGESGVVKQTRKNKGRNDVEWHGIDEFRHIKQGTADYLDAIKELAEKEAKSKSYVSPTSGLSKHLPAVREYLENSDLSYKCAAVANNTINTEFGYLLNNDALSRLPDEFVLWYDKQLDKCGIRREFDGNWQIYTIPVRYTTNSIYNTAYKAVIFELCKQHGWQMNQYVVSAVAVDDVIDKAAFGDDYIKLQARTKSGELTKEQGIKAVYELVDTHKTVNATAQDITAVHLNTYLWQL